MGVSLADEGCVSSQALVMELVQDLPLAIHVSDATRDDVVIETWRCRGPHGGAQRVDRIRGHAVVRRRRTGRVER
jgi:hypothetical protein